MGKISNWDIIFGAVGETQADIYKGLANHDVPFVDTAIRLTCNINAAYSDTLARSAYERGFINRLCDLTNNPLPARIPANFSGGQCDGVIYRVLVKVERFDTNGSQVPDTAFVFNSVRGAIQDVNVIPFADDPNRFTVAVVGTNADGSRQVNGQELGVGFSSANVAEVTVTRPDGLPDDCGDPPDGLPPSPPRPDQFCEVVQTDVDLPPGTFEIVEADEGCIDGDTNLTFPICIEYQGFELCFDLDGIFKNPLGDEKKIGEKPFDEEDFDEEDAECTPPEDVELEENGEPPEGVEACEGETEELQWLIVTITKFSDTGKIIVHKDEEFTDYFAGYVVWKITKQGQDYYLPAIPIRKKHNAYKPPIDVNGYGVYTTNGAKVSIKELKEKKTDGRNV